MHTVSSGTLDEFHMVVYYEYSPALSAFRQKLQRSFLYLLLIGIFHPELYPSATALQCHHGGVDI